MVHHEGRENNEFVRLENVLAVLDDVLAAALLQVIDLEKFMVVGADHVVVDARDPLAGKGPALRHEKCCLVDHGVVPFRRLCAVFRGMSPLYTKWIFLQMQSSRPEPRAPACTGTKRSDQTHRRGKRQGDGRNVGDQQQQDDFRHHIGDQGADDLFNGQLADAAGDEQDRADGRGHGAQAHVEGQHHAELDQVHAQAGDDGQEDGGEDQAGGGDVQEGAHDEQHHVHEQQDDILVVRDRHDGIADSVGDAGVGHDPAYG